MFLTALFIMAQTGSNPNAHHGGMNKQTVAHPDNRTIKRDSHSGDTDEHPQSKRREASHKRVHAVWLPVRRIQTRQNWSLGTEAGSGFLGACGDSGRGKGRSDLLLVIGMVCLSVGVLVTCIKTHQTVRLRFIKFSIYKSSLNKKAKWEMYRHTQLGASSDTLHGAAAPA